MLFGKGAVAKTIPICFCGLESGPLCYVLTLLSEEDKRGSRALKPPDTIKRHGENAAESSCEALLSEDQTDDPSVSRTSATSNTALPSVSADRDGAARRPTPAAPAEAGREGDRPEHPRPDRAAGSRRSETRAARQPAPASAPLLSLACSSRRPWSRRVPAPGQAGPRDPDGLEAVGSGAVARGPGSRLTSRGTGHSSGPAGHGGGAGPTPRSEADRIKAQAGASVPGWPLAGLCPRGPTQAPGLRQPLQDAQEVRCPPTGHPCSLASPFRPEPR